MLDFGIFVILLAPLEVSWPIVVHLGPPQAPLGRSLVPVEHHGDQLGSSWSYLGLSSNQQRLCWTPLSYLGTPLSASRPILGFIENQKHKFGPPKDNADAIWKPPLAQLFIIQLMKVLLLNYFNAELWHVLNVSRGEANRSPSMLY